MTLRTLPPHAEFWMVCGRPMSAASKTTPVRRYTTQAAAIEAAERLCDQNGRDHVVLHSVGLVSKTDTNQQALL